jgi:hypothetical protein
VCARAQDKLFEEFNSLAVIYGLPADRFVKPALSANYAAREAQKLGGGDDDDDDASRAAAHAGRSVAPQGTVMAESEDEDEDEDEDESESESESAAAASAGRRVARRPPRRFWERRRLAAAAAAERNAAARAARARGRVQPRLGDLSGAGQPRHLRAALPSISPLALVPRCARASRRCRP